MPKVYKRSTNEVQFPCWLWNDGNIEWERHEKPFEMMGTQHSHWVPGNEDKPKGGPLDYKVK